MHAHVVLDTMTSQPNYRSMGDDQSQIMLLDMDAKHYCMVHILYVHSGKLTDDQKLIYNFVLETQVSKH